MLLPSESAEDVEQQRVRAGQATTINMRRHRRITRQVANPGSNLPRRQQAPTVRTEPPQVPQIDAVIPGKVSLHRIRLQPEQAEEAGHSPLSANPATWA